MYGKMQASGLTEFIPFICTSAVWGQILFPVTARGDRCGAWLLLAPHPHPPPPPQQPPWGKGWRHLLDFRHCVLFWEPSFTLLLLLLLLCFSHVWCPIDSSLPGSPIPGILQARALEWVAMSFSTLGDQRLLIAVTFFILPTYMAGNISFQKTKFLALRYVDSECHLPY